MVRYPPPRCGRPGVGEAALASRSPQRAGAAPAPRSPRASRRRRSRVRPRGARSAHRRRGRRRRTPSRGRRSWGTNASATYGTTDGQEARMQRPCSVRQTSSASKVGASATPIVGGTSNRLASRIERGRPIRSEHAPDESPERNRQHDTRDRETGARRADAEVPRELRQDRLRRVHRREHPGRSKHEAGESLLERIGGVHPDRLRSPGIVPSRDGACERGIGAVRRGRAEARRGQLRRARRRRRDGAPAHGSRRDAAA